VIKISSNAKFKARVNCTGTGGAQLQKGAHRDFQGSCNPPVNLVVSIGVYNLSFFL
jgi:hypothetical protein